MVSLVICIGSGGGRAGEIKGWNNIGDVRVPRVLLAALALSGQGVTKICEAEGDEPVDAIFKTMECIVKSGAELHLYSVNAVTQ